MSPEDTIRYTLYHFPSIMHNSASALHHMFCVIGNGYEWINGELVDPFEEENEHDPYTPPYPEDYWHRQETDSQPLNDMLDDIRAKLNVEYVTKAKEANARIEERMVDVSFDRDHLYPLHKEYAKLFNYPEDITPEWRACLEEAQSLFLPLYEKLQRCPNCSGWTRYYGDEKYCKECKNRGFVFVD